MPPPLNTPVCVCLCMCDDTHVTRARRNITEHDVTMTSQQQQQQQLIAAADKVTSAMHDIV